MRSTVRAVIVQPDVTAALPAVFVQPTGSAQRIASASISAKTRFIFIRIPPLYL